MLTLALSVLEVPTAIHLGYLFHLLLFLLNNAPFSWVHGGELLFTEKPFEGKKTYSTASLARALCPWPFTFISMSPFKPLLPPSRWRARYRRIKKHEKENKKIRKG
jgi:hypothetical protein